MVCPITGQFTPGSEFHKPSTPPSDKGTVNSTDVDPRAMIAVARMNWLHSRYKIVSHALPTDGLGTHKSPRLSKSNGDYLYTLALFVFETPVRPVSRLVVLDRIQADSGNDRPGPPGMAGARSPI
jgi:hypothetical protein